MVLTANIAQRSGLSGVLALFVLALGLGSCVREPAVQRLQAPAAVAVALVHERGSAATAVPSDYADIVSRALLERNLEPRPVAIGGDAGALEGARDTRRRLDVLASSAGDADYLVLVETRAEFYSQIVGRFRWAVAVKITVARRNHLDEASISEFDLPVTLAYEHQREDAALRESASAVARELGRELDALLAGVPAGADAAAAAGNPSAPAPEVERAAIDSIYFVLVDRFANGDPANDEEIDLADPAAFHGGDLAGIIGKLDYLQALGVDALWLSPVFAMRTEKVGEHGAFHGYWTEDLARIEPRMGSGADLRKLADELRKRQMGLILDVVLNHVGYDAPLTRERPEWFHGGGDIENWDDPAELTGRDVHGLPDLAQERKDVAEYLIAVSKRWFDALQPLGFRLDAVKHVPMAFWKHYTDELRRHSGGTLELIGELYDGDPRRLAKGFASGGFDALFDFPLYFAMTDVFCRGEHPGRLAALLSLDRLYPDPQKLVTFADNHDLPRVASACGGDAARVRQLLRFQLSARGIPAITYGTEVGLQGESEPQNRGDMVFPPEPRHGRELRELLALRRAHTALLRGRSWIFHLDDRSLAYARVAGAEIALIGLNLGSERLEVPLPRPLSTGGAGESLLIEPGTTSIEVVSGDFSALDATLRAGASATIELRIENAPGGDLRVVGSAPELGGWDPEAGVRAVLEKSEWVARFRLPRGEAAAFKLVSMAGPAPSWEERDNRYILARESSESRRLRWGH